MASIRDIDVTDYGTVIIRNVKDDYLVYYGEENEVPLNKFFKKLYKKVNKMKCGIDYNCKFYAKPIATVTPMVTVKAKDEDGDPYLINIDDDCYKLCIKGTKNYYPILKEKLDELTKISKAKIDEQDVVKRFEDDRAVEANEIDAKIYLKHLKKYSRKLSLIKGLVHLPLITLPLGIISIVLNHIGLGILILLPTILAVAELGVEAIEILAGNPGSILKNFKYSKITKLKIKKIEKLLTRKHEIAMKLDSKTKNKTKKDIYTDSIINYMNTILEGTNKLNNVDKRQKLYELRDILDEYTKKCQDLQNDDTVLSFNSKKAIMAETLDKLAILEMEVAEIARRDKENSKISSESEKLRNKINAYIDIVNENETDLVSNNHKVRTLSK